MTKRVVEVPGKRVQMDMNLRKQAETRSERPFQNSRKRRTMAKIKLLRSDATKERVRCRARHWPKNRMGKYPISRLRYHVAVFDVEEIGFDAISGVVRDLVGIAGQLKQVVKSKRRSLNRVTTRVTSGLSSHIATLVFS